MTQDPPESSRGASPRADETSITPERVRAVAGATAVHEGEQPRVNVQGGGQSGGIPADAQFDEHSFNPMGNPGREHWQASTITGAGVEDRSSVFFAVVEMTRMPMLICDGTKPDYPVAFANRAFLDLTGLREAEVVGRNPRILQGPETDPETVAEVRCAIEQQRACAVELVNYKADGTPFWNALFLGPVFDADGTLRYWFASQVDVSQRRSSQQSLLQAQKLEAIGQLTAGMAHDFNNLLHVVVGNLEIARQLAGRPEAAETVLGSLARAERAAVKGGKLTQQLLSFARKQRLEPRDVNLNALVVEFSEMLVRTLGAHIDLRLDLKPGLPNCQVDPVHLEMALLNVLINARDAMPDGGRVTIATSLGDPALGHDRMGEGGGVVLCVRDEGPGMPAHVMRRATEPFFTTKRTGTGLGLAMVHGFAEQSHGRLEIVSEPGQGTTIRLVFPLGQRTARASGGGGAIEDLRHDPDVGAEAAQHDGAPEARHEGRREDPARDDESRPIARRPAASGAPASAPRSAQRAAPASSSSQPGAETGAAALAEHHAGRPLVWVVEDSDDVRALCEQALLGMGCRVVSSASGDEAVRTLQARGDVAVLLTDIMMPGRTDGRALARRAREAWPAMEVVLMTGYADAMPDDALGGAGAGGPSRVLTKPFHADDLRRAVSEALREHWQLA